MIDREQGRCLRFSRHLSGQADRGLVQLAEGDSPGPDQSILRLEPECFGGAGETPDDLDIEFRAYAVPGGTPVEDQRQTVGPQDLPAQGHREAVTGEPLLCVELVQAQLVFGVPVEHRVLGSCIEDHGRTRLLRA